MIRALSLAAALAFLPASATLAQETKTPAEAQLEVAAAAFEKKMDEFGERVEVINENDSLTKEQKKLLIGALWSEYQPHMTAFTALATQQAGEIAQEALAEADIGALVTEALAGVAPLVHGLATNSSWVQGDPDQAVTYGLMADYAMGQASDELEAMDDEDEDEAPVAPVAPPAAPVTPSAT